MKLPVISCRDLSHRYFRKYALSQINFEIQSGEPVGLVGPNGAGKSTLLNILCGYLKPTSGEVKVLNKTPGDFSLVGRIAALPQDAQFDPEFSIGEQLVHYAKLQGFSKIAAQNESKRVLEAVSMESHFFDKPFSLSHGMNKRIAFAQTLIGQPELVLLDEPTAGLDPVNTRKIRTIITEQSTDSTFFISSHNLDELGRVCQSVLMLNEGVMNHVEVADSEKSRFFTLTMNSCPILEVIKSIQAIEGVLHVSSSQKNELLIECSEEQYSAMDIKILQCLTTNQWSYRQLNKGQSLEQKLFFKD